METQGTERNPNRLIEQLQTVQVRQRKLIQQLQAENARRLSNLSDVRLERDAFRKEAARARKENAELQNRLEEVFTEYLDLKRERATLARSVVTAGHSHGRNSNVGLKILNTTLPALDEEQTESTPVEDRTAITEKAGRLEVESYLYRALPDPPESESPRPDQPVSTSTRNSSRGPIPESRTVLRSGHGATLSL